MPVAMNGSIELFYESFGFDEDPTIICIPGMGSQMLSFAEEFCLALVDRGFHVIRMDNRDSGLSSETDDEDEYTLRDMAKDVVAVLDASEVREAVVLGFSLGGMIAQQIAIDHPQRVRALVSVSSSPGEEGLPEVSEEITAALTEAPKQTLAEQIEADIARRRLWSNPDWFDVETLTAYFTKLHERSDMRGGGSRQYRAMDRSPSRVEGLCSLTVPTLVVHGENDTLLPVEHGRRTAELILDAEYLQIDGMSHDFVYQMWPPLIEAVTNLTARTFAA